MSAARFEPVSDSIRDSKIVSADRAYGDDSTRSYSYMR